MTTLSPWVASIVIPASNEAHFLPRCLSSLLDSDLPQPGVELIVVSNGSTDGTPEIARGFDRAAAAKGWRLKVLDLARGGKLNALNAGDGVAQGRIRIYVDADVTVSPRLLAGLVRTLDRPEAGYASGEIRIMADGTVSRAYARFWAQVPFMVQGVPGCGLFAVNGAGRARWGDWPQIIADDLYARLHFAPSERHLVHEPYDWPIAEGFTALVRVRRRQDRGTQEITERFPHLLVNEDKPFVDWRTLAALGFRHPLDFAFYASVALAVRARRADGTWTRSR